MLKTNKLPPHIRQNEASDASESNAQKYLRRKFGDFPVQWLPLGEVCEIKRGKRLTKSQVTKNGLYPVISGGVSPMGFFDNFNREENTITIAQYGTAGFVNWQTSKFWANDVCYSLFCKDIIDNKYLYYYLKNAHNEIDKMVVYEATPYHLPQSKLQQFLIPIPPMEVQNEVVEILDKFTALLAELKAELKARKLQYEYYRDQLLSFPDDDPNVQWLPLEDAFYMRNGYTPSKAVPEYWENGTIPWFRMEDIRTNGSILSDSIQHITPEAVKGGRLFPSGSIILSTTATIGEHALIIADSLANQRFTNLTLRESLSNQLDMKFFYYYMFIIDNWCKNNVNVSGFASVDMKKLKKLLIPIPPMEEQERIVGILYKFDTLTNSLTEGIPKEIEMRQMQYEYYRDAFLSF